MQPARITIFDTTLRDGEQSPGCSMNVQEKLRMAHRLDQLGVDVIEAGFPIASDGDFEAVQAVSAMIQRPTIAGLARACRPDIERAWQALHRARRPRIHIFLATSDIHLKYKLRISREQCLEQARDAVAFARERCADVEFSPEDATRSDPGFLCKVLEAVVEAGATTINIPDTVGYSMPSEYADLIARVLRTVNGAGGVTMSTHCHNDLGLAVANTLAAVAAGARQVECTINGIGERAGNASLEEIVMACRVRPDRYPYRSNVNPELLYPASQTLSEITGVAVQPNKAIIGRNAFAHEAGIHQDGVLKNPLTYEIMTPKSVGVPDSTLVLGKHSGRHALGLRCEQLGHTFDRRGLDEIYRKFVILADDIKQVEDHHLLRLIRDVTSGTPHAEPATMKMIAAVSSRGTAFSRRRLGVKRTQDARILPGLPAPDSSAEEDSLWGV